MPKVFIHTKRFRDLVIALKRRKQIRNAYAVATYIAKREKMKMFLKKRK